MRFFCVPKALAGVALLALMTTWAEHSSACSCLAEVNVSWPEVDAVDVPIDTPVIVGGVIDAAQFQQPLLLVAPPTDAGVGSSGQSDAGAGVPSETTQEVSGLHLVSATGQRVALQLVRVAATHLCIGAYHFARPVTDLEVNARYELRIGETLLRAFTTGSARHNADAEKAAAEGLVWETLGSLQEPSQISTAFVTNLGSVGLYLNFKGLDEETTVSTEHTEAGRVQLDFGSLTCPEVQVLGLGGETLVTKSLCTANRCVQLNGEVVISSCGGNYNVGVGYEQFLTLPIGCSVAPGVTNDTPSTTPSASATASASSAATVGSEDDVDQLEPRKVAITEPSDASGSGCHVIAARHERAARGWWTAVALGIGLFRRRALR